MAQNSSSRQRAGDDDTNDNNTNNQSGITFRPVARYQWQDDDRSPAAQCAVCCVGCILFLAVLLVVLWLLVLQFNVGAYAIRNNVSCDKPLAKYLIGQGSLICVALLFQFIAMCLVACKKQRALEVVAFFAFMMLFGNIALLVAGNVWVFSSTNCSREGVPPPTALMFPLYDASKIIVITLDVLLGLVLTAALVFAIVYFGVQKKSIDDLTKSIEAENQRMAFEATVAPAMGRPGFLRQVSNNPAVMPAASFQRWASRRWRRGDPEYQQVSTEDEDSNTPQNRAIQQA